MRLKDLVTVRNIKTERTDLPYIALENIVSWEGTFIPTDIQTEGTNARYYAGDVLFGKLRPYLAKAFIPDNDGICSTEFLVLKANKGLNNKFLEYYLLSPNFIDYIRNQVAGVKMPRTNWTEIGNLVVDFPDRKKQDSIVLFLDKQIDSINRRIKLREKELEALIKLKQSVVDSVITRGLDPSVDFKDSGIPLAPSIPSHWEVVRLAQIGVFSASGIDKLFVEGETPVHIINYVDVYKNDTRELFNEEYMLVTAPGNKAKEHQVRVGDIIFTPSSETFDDIGIGAVVVEDIPNTAYSYHVLRFRPNTKLYLGFEKYMCNNVVCTNYFSSHSAGTIRKTLSRNAFKNCPIILPPYDEQVQIADYLDKKISDISTKVNNINEQIKRLLQLKKSLINEVISGQRTVL